MLAEGQLSVTVFNEKLHSVNELTSLLHRSYKRLADMGLYYQAASQSPERTLERLVGAVCLIAIKDESIIGTISFYPGAYTNEEKCAWFDRADVGRFGQFAVDPGHQKLGLGKIFIDMIEGLAVEHGKNYLALDTSEKAGHLIDYYDKLGYEHVEYMQWNDANYRSVVMSKNLKSKI